MRCKGSWEASRFFTTALYSSFIHTNHVWVVRESDKAELHVIVFSWLMLQLLWKTWCVNGMTRDIQTNKQPSKASLRLDLSLALTLITIKCFEMPVQTNPQHSSAPAELTVSRADQQQHSVQSWPTDPQRTAKYLNISKDLLIHLKDQKTGQSEDCPSAKILFTQCPRGLI